MQIRPTRLFRLRSTAQLSELSDRAIAGPLERPEETGSLFLVKCNRG